jgi:hypothetical protein
MVREPILKKYSSNLKSVDSKALKVATPAEFSLKLKNNEFNELNLAATGTETVVTEFGKDTLLP